MLIGGIFYVVATPFGHLFLSDAFGYTLVGFSASFLFFVVQLTIQRFAK